MRPTPAPRHLLLLGLAVLALVPLVVRMTVFGTLPADFGVFPPARSPNVPGFSWWVFGPGVAFALAIAAFVLRPRWFGFRPAPAATPTAPRAGLPPWCLPGALLCIAAWALAWELVPGAGPLVHYAFVPLWWGFILFLDGLVYHRTGGVSLVARRPAGVLAIAAVSTVCWYSFEYLNWFVLSNWYYPNREIFTPLGYVAWFAVAYTTVLPSIFVFYNLLTTFPALRTRWSDGPRVALQPRRLWNAFWLGVVSLAALVVWPAELFPMLWLSPLMILASVVMLAGRWTPFTPLARGDWGPLTLIALACLGNYGLGEMWNYYSTAANPNFWQYDVPYVGVLKVFEMPLLGYFGYLPFGVLCWVWWQHHAHLLGLDPAIDVVPGAGPMLDHQGQ